MTRPVPPFDPLYLPLIFVGMWLFISTLLGFLSGWYGLRRRFLDNQDRGKRLASSTALTAWMGAGVHLNGGILKVEAYERGLRLCFSRICGPFHLPLFIPWDQIHVERSDKFLFRGGGAILKFGEGGVFSRMGLEQDLANALWRSTGKLWPEKGLAPPRPTNFQVLGKVLRKWGLYAFVATAFFLIVPLTVSAPGHGPPITVAILFPVIVMGIMAAIEYFHKTRSR